MKKISLKRVRPERSKFRRLSIVDEKLVTLQFSITPSLKKLLTKEAKRQGLSISLYLNLLIEKTLISS